MLRKYQNPNPAEIVPHIVVRNGIYKIPLQRQYHGLASGTQGTLFRSTRRVKPRMTAVKTAKDRPLDQRIVGVPRRTTQPSSQSKESKLRGQKKNVITHTILCPNHFPTIQAPTTSGFKQRTRGNFGLTMCVRPNLGSWPTWLHPWVYREACRKACHRCIVKDAHRHTSSKPGILGTVLAWHLDIPSPWIYLDLSRKQLADIRTFSRSQTCIHE